MADPNQNRVIDDVLFQAFQNASAIEQKNFIDSLNEEELSELEFLVTGKTIGPTTYASRATYPTGPDGMPLYDYPIESSGRQDVAMELFSGLREQGFDYTGLPDSGLRRGLSFMDTAGEKEAYLTDKVGPEGVGWTTDKYGRYAIMPEFREKLGGTPGDKPLTIDNPGKYDKGDIADLAGSAPEITATILASIASRNYGLLPATLASAGAAGTAKTLEELTESGLGMQQQSVRE